jgi:hypothetical protein
MSARLAVALGGRLGLPPIGPLMRAARRPAFSLSCTGKARPAPALADAFGASQPALWPPVACAGGRLDAAAPMAAWEPFAREWQAHASVLPQRPFSLAIQPLHELLEPRPCSPSLELSSTKKKRRTKMNRHKVKKRRKKDRFKNKS